MTLGSRVAVMRDGTVQQVDTPQTLYREPDNLFVAAFIGSPSMNLVEAGSPASRSSSPASGSRSRPAAARPAARTTPVILGIRPQDFEEGRTAAAGCRGSRSMPPSSRSSARRRTSSSSAPPVDADAVRAATDEGERATLLATDRRALFTAEVAEEARVRPGDRIELASTARFHFFDPETGASLRARPPSLPQPDGRVRRLRDREAGVDDRGTEPPARRRRSPRGRSSGRARPEDDRARQGQARLCRRRSVEGLAAARELDAVVVGVGTGAHAQLRGLEAGGGRGGRRRPRRGSRRRRGCGRLGRGCVSPTDVSRTDEGRRGGLPGRRRARTRRRRRRGRPVSGVVAPPVVELRSAPAASSAW